MIRGRRRERRARGSRTGSGPLVAGRDVLDEDDRRAIGAHADRDRVGSDRRQPPGAVDRRRRSAEAGLDDELVDDRLRASSSVAIIGPQSGWIGTPVGRSNIRSRVLARMTSSPG